jgi:outer membrane protein assembly factor BamB/DNA-directed RNA polymerase subunit RPC12/RpoP
MSASSSTLTSSECPNCGAPIDLSTIKPGDTQIECAHCGSMLNLPGRQKLREIQAQTIVIKMGDVAPAQPVKKPGGGGCVGLLVVLLTLGIPLVVLWQTGVLNMFFGERVSVTTNVPGLPEVIQVAPGARIFGDPLPTPLANDQPQEVLYLTSAGDGARAVSYSPSKRAETWRSPQLSDSITDIALAADAERAYVADGERLLAINRSDGSTAWEIALPYAINNGYYCEEARCLRVFGAHVVLRLKDGTLLALDAQTGRTAWQKRLNYTSGGVFDALGHPAALDTADGKNSDATFTIYDAASGDVKAQFSPCHDGRRSYTACANAADSFIPTPDGKFMYVVSEASTAAVWKFDLSDGAQQWVFAATRDDEDGTAQLPFIGSPPYLATDDALYIVQGSSDAFIARVDAATGEAKQIFAEARYNIQAVAATDDVLVVQAQPTFDNTKRELWGLDGKTGERKWQIGLKTKHSFDDFAVHVTPDGRLFLAQTQREEGKALFDALDPQTGVSRGQVSQAVERADLQGQAFDGETAWLNLSSYLYQVDMTTGDVKGVWP